MSRFARRAEVSRSLAELRRGVDELRDRLLVEQEVTQGLRERLLLVERRNHELSIRLSAATRDQRAAPTSVAHAGASTHEAGEHTYNGSANGSAATPVAVGLPAVTTALGAAPPIHHFVPEPAATAHVVPVPAPPASAPEELPESTPGPSRAPTAEALPPPTPEPRPAATPPPPRPGHSIDQVASIADEASSSAERNDWAIEEVRGSLDRLNRRVDELTTTLHLKLQDLGWEIERTAASTRAAAAVSDLSLDRRVEALREAQIRLAEEQARYEIALRTELADIADSLRHSP